MAALLVSLMPILVGAALAQSKAGRSDANLTAKMREGWDGKTTWTRMYLVSALGNLPDTAQVRERLLRCPEAIGQLVEPYYGKTVADSFGLALQQHLKTLMSYVLAIKYGNAEALDAVRIRLRADAAAVAERLGRINAAWSEPQFRELFDVYLQLTEREITLRAQGDYAGDIENFGKLHEVGNRLAEKLSSDVIAQFQPRLAPGEH